MNFVTSENSADQTFENGYNIGNVALALGDPAVCAAVPNCVPLDLFGGQGRPFTQDMINFIRATQIDSSKQTLQLASANITGDLFNIGDRTAGFAVGAEHRKYAGDFHAGSAAPDRPVAGLLCGAGLGRLRRQRGVFRSSACRCSRRST